MDSSKSISTGVTIHASAAKVWDVITNERYAKVLGSEFDKDAFVVSDWKKGSKVDFVYEPDKIVSTGIISEIREEELISVDYDFGGYLYKETYSLNKVDNGTILKIDAGPYGDDFESQKVVWKNWLNKVKELCESN